MNLNPKNRASHSEIEKRRRQKLNKYLNELLNHLPVGSNKNKKPDKITILKIAVQHMKNLKGNYLLVDLKIISEEKKNYLKDFFFNVFIFYFKSLEFNTEWFVSMPKLHHTRGTPITCAQRVQRVSHGDQIGFEQNSVRVWHLLQLYRLLIGIVTV